jgi:hypothetical protein
MAQDKGQVAECCDEGDEHLGSVQFGEIFDHLRNYKILKKTSVARTQCASSSKTEGR